MKLTVVKRSEFPIPRGVEARTRCLLDKNTVEKIRVLKRRKERVGNAGGGDLYDLPSLGFYEYLVLGSMENWQHTCTEPLASAAVSAAGPEPLWNGQTSGAERAGRFRGEGPPSGKNSRW